MPADYIDVSATEPRIYYTVGGTAETEFVVPFMFFEDADLQVYVDEVLQTLNDDYTVSGAEDEDGGTVTFLYDVANADVAIVRDIVIDLDTHIPSFGPLDITGINLQFSRFIAILQELESTTARSLHVADSVELPDDGFLLLSSLDANEFLIVNADGTGIETTEVVTSSDSYIVATESQAKAGALNTALMTPQRTREAVGVSSVTTRTLLKAIATAGYNTAILTEAGREGMFQFRSGDYAARVTADTTEGIYIKADDTATTSGAWVRAYTGWANVKWFGALGDNSAADLAALQAATDLVDAVWIPNGTYKTNGPWLLDDAAELHFESRAAIILSTSASDIIRPRGYTTTRNYYIQIHSGKLQSTGTSGSNGINFMSTSMAKVYGTWINNCNVGILNGGTGSQGAYYNDYFGVDITTCTCGVRNGTLGNEIHFYGGRVTDVTVATDDDNNSGVLYDGVAIETFTNSGHRLANTGSACVDVRSIGCRFENPSGNPAYASAVGVRIAATAQDTSIIAPGFTTVVTNITDSGVRTQVLFAEDWNQFASGTRFKTLKRVEVTQAISVLAAGATRQESYTIAGVAAGDSVKVTLPSIWPSGLNCSPPIIGSGVIYLQLHNPTGSGISMAAATHVFEITDY